MLLHMSESGRVQALIFADAKGFIRYWNDDAESVFGYAASEIVGRSMETVIPPEFRERHWAAFDPAMASTDVDRIDSGSVALPGLHKDGSRLDLEVHLFRIPDSRGHSAGALAVFSPVARDLPPLESLYD